MGTVGCVKRTIRVGARWCVSRTLLLVDGLGVEHALALDPQPLRRHAAEEAALVALVAGRPADLLDLEEDRVGVAIDVDALHDLHVAALLALAPELVAAAREVARPAGAQGLL